MSAFLRTSILLALVTMMSCSWISRKSITSQYYRDYGELIVLTRNAPTTYYEGSKGQTVGFEHDLILEFVRSMNVKARFIVVDTIEEIYEQLQKGHAHLAAAGLAITPQRKSEFLFGPSYMTVEEQVVCHRDIKVKRLKDLIGKKVMVVNSSSYLEKLNQLKTQQAELSWLTTDEKSTEQILSMVWQKQLDCTVADSIIFDLNRRQFPELEVAFDLTENVSIAWMLPREQKKLRQDLQKWFVEAEKDQRLQNIKDRYFGVAPKHDFYDLHVFHQRVKTRLPQYMPLFRQAANQVNIDWRLLAAVSYQESHWEPEARSPTGVRGMMMLTNITAQEMNVSNRLDPEESVLGGSRYLRKMLRRVPTYIAPEERIWFALAAYNVGWSHLQDARKLAIDIGKNPNLWEEVKSVLPLLSQKKYYRQLRHGYARGHEPVIYVARIQQYYELLRGR